MVNTVFTRIIKVSEGVLEFNFRKIPGDLQSYQVDVTDNRGYRIQFSISRNSHGAWHSTGTLLPMWIIKAEHAIGEAIEEEIPQLNTH